jgi:hypothetical protein
MRPEVRRADRAHPARRATGDARTGGGTGGCRSRREGARQVTDRGGDIERERRPHPWGRRVALLAAASAALAGCTAGVPPGRAGGRGHAPGPAARGIIRPPEGIDPGIHTTVPVPDPGTMPVIPPPGFPGGDPRIEPR